MRVLLISHTCQSKTEGQPKAECLGRIAGVELCVYVPNRWRHYGCWRAASVPSRDVGYRYELGKIAWPWIGPAQSYLHWYPGLSKLLREFKPDVIDLWEEPWGLVSAHACWLRNRLLPTAKIVSETEQNLNKILPQPFGLFRRYTLRHANYAVGRNADALDVIRSHGYRGPAEVVPNAVDTDLFRPLERERCRRDLGVQGFVVGYIGRLVEEKGLSDLIGSLPHCPADVNVLLVGSGPFQPSLEAQAIALGVTHRVRFVGPKPLEELPKLMNAIDVLVLPSRTTARWKEQFGRVIIEAHACGVPVIGSDSGAIPSVVGNGGLVFRERDPRDLARRITDLHSHPAEARALGAAGSSQVEAHYTWERVAARMHAIYLKVLNSQSTAMPPSPTNTVGLV